MRVLVISSFYPPHHLGGYEVACAQAVEGLRRRGHRVEVLTSTHRVAERDRGHARRELALFWEDGEWRRPGLLGAARATRRDVASFDRAAGELQPELVWAWQMAALSKAPLAQTQARGIPLVLAVHDLWPLYERDTDPWFRWHRGWRRPVGTAVRAVFRLPRRPPELPRAAASYNSAWTRDEIAGRGLAPDGPVIPPGVDPDAFRPSPLDRPVRRFLFAARLDPRKGAMVALEALSLARAAGLDASLTLAGASEGGHQDDLRAAAEAWRVTGAVRFAGAVPAEAMPDLYAEHDAVVHAATWEEPFGLVPLEAMAAGRPVIASPTGGAREVVDSENALTFEPGDAGACARQMAALAADRELVARLVESGRRTAERFSAERAVAAHEEHLLSVASGAPRAAATAGR